MLASTDKLTGLPNRHTLEELIEAQIARFRRYGSIFSVILLDVDRFKSVNDNHGHLAGDRFLQELSTLLTQRLRSTDVAGRWGGEEFLIVCPETGGDKSLGLAEQIGDIVSTHDFGLGRQCTVSQGVSFIALGDDTDSLLMRADTALYRAKHQGRNRACQQPPET